MMDNLQANNMLNKYRIIEKIGQGGMATIYKAFQTNMGREVAIKVLYPRLARDRTFLQLFKKEVRLIASLEHTHILPVYDYGELDGVPYLVMRYVNKGTLKGRIDAAPLSLAEVDHYFTAVASALAYAHEMGVIHRDVKSLNIILDERGEIFLTDFGIAKLVADVKNFSITGELPCTPAYMSPEQAEGLPADYRSDIYAFGIVLYEMLTRQVPFQADNPLAIMLDQITRLPACPSEINPDLSPRIDRVVLKALAKKPENRYASILEFENAWKDAIRS